MKKIAENFRGHYREIILGPLFKLLEAVLELLVPLVMADIIDAGVRSGDISYVLRRGGLMVLLAVLGAAAGLTCQYYAAVAGGHFGRGLRRQLYAHVMRFSPAESARFGAGGLITRLTNDVNQIQTGVNMVIRLGTRVPYLAIGGMVMALLINWKIGLIFLAAAPVIALILTVIMRITLPGYTAIQAGQDKISRLAGENLDGVRVIRAFSRQRQEIDAFDEAGEDMTRLLVRVGRISALLNPLTGLVANMAVVSIVWLGARFAFAGDAHPGEIIALVSYMNQIVLALVLAANLIVLFTRAIASARRVAVVLDTEPSIVDGPGARPDPAAPALAFEDVTFAYHEGGSPALEDICFAVRPGMQVGIIGGTGSGKTTLASLLLRSYDPSAGTIRRGGQPLPAYTLGELRGGIGYVPQGATLFTGTVRHNLLVSHPDATDDELWRALDIAQADFVRNLPEGLDAPVVEGGTNLSGGQRQRLTIARALVREPDILILDDASSALDYATDARLRRALAEQNREGGGMTVLTISQRAAAIKNADMILVMDDGRLVGSGAHEELLEQNEVYREICVSQGLCKGEAG